MTKRFFSLTMMAVLALGAWADNTTVSSQTLWTFGDYAGQTVLVENHQGIYLHAPEANVFGTDNTHASALAGTFTGSTVEWTTTNVLTCSKGAGASFLTLGNVGAQSSDGATATLAFNHAHPGRLYVVYGAISMTDGTFYIRHRGSSETAFTTVYEQTMSGIDYQGILGAPHRSASYEFGMAEAMVNLDGAGTVYLGGTEPYCIYAILYVPEYSVSDATMWTFDALTTGDSYGSFSSVKVVDETLYARGSSARSRVFDVTESSETGVISFGDGSARFTVGKTLTQSAAANNPGYIPTTATALTSVVSLVDGSSERKDCGVGMLAVNVEVEGTLSVIFKSSTTGENGFRMYHRDSQSSATYSWTDDLGVTSTSTLLKNVASIKTDGTVQTLLANVSAGTVFFGDVLGKCEIFAVKFMPLEDGAVTLSVTDGSKNRKDYKNLKVNNLSSGSTLYYILPGETAVRTYVPNDSLTLNNVSQNGYLTYWETNSYGVSSKKKNIAVQAAPSVRFKDVAADASTYTIRYTSGNTLHYLLPGSDTEQIVSGGTTADVTIATTGGIVVWQTVDDVASEQLSTNVFAPTPSIVEDGKYDFSELKNKVGSGYTIALGSYPWGEEVTIGDMTLKKPGLMTSKTLDRFAFNYINEDNTTNTNWRLVTDGRLRVAKRSTTAYIAILGLTKGEYISITHNGVADLTYQSSSTATLEEGTTTLASGQVYEVTEGGALLLSVASNTEKEFDISQIAFVNGEVVTAPTLQARTESGQVVPNVINLVMGTSNLGKTVTAYYTTDGTTPTVNSTAMTASGKITVDESCTVKAVCISETGVSSAVTTYQIDLPDADPTAPVVYDLTEMMEDGQQLTFSTTKNTVYYMDGNSTWNETHADFYKVTNLDNKVSIRAGSSSVSYDTSAKTVQISRTIAIHDLGVGDEIVIVYSGGGSLLNVGSATGDSFTVGGQTQATGEEVRSGEVIKVTKTKYANNYVVLGISGIVYIHAIYINSQAPATVLRPKVELNRVETDHSVYRVTFDKGARLHYVFTSEGAERTGSNTGSYDLDVYTSSNVQVWATNGNLSSDTLTTVVYAPTPAPSEEGDYDFAEASVNLPTDIPVTLDAAQLVSVEGVMLYKPSALTAQTFNNKFAFSETNVSGKIKIRTNRHLAFNQGVNMNMALLDMKQGDIISFDYTGSIKFVNSDMVVADVQSNVPRRAASIVMESGVPYIVQQDGDVLLSLELENAPVSIAKMYVAAPPANSSPMAIDFVSAGEENEELDMGGSASVWMGEKTAATVFKRLANESDDLPIAGKVSTEGGNGTMTTSGIKLGSRNFAIHALAKGDVIKVRYTGGTLTYNGHDSKGSRISVNGQLLQRGDQIASGDELVVEQVDYLDNYVVLMPNNAVITGIFINEEEVEKVLMPIITANGQNTFKVTGGVSTLGNEISTYYTTDGTNPSLTNGTGGPYASFDVQLLRGNEVMVKAVSISETGVISRIAIFYIYAVDLTPVDEIEADIKKEAVIYDLRGNRVKTMMPGTIYIINGKKVLYNKK